MAKAPENNHSECKLRYHSASLSRFLRNTPSYMDLSYISCSLQYLQVTSYHRQHTNMVVATEHNFPPQTSHLYTISRSMRKFLSFHCIHVSRRLTGAIDEFYARKQLKTDHLMHHLRLCISSTHLSSNQCRSMQHGSCFWVSFSKSLSPTHCALLFCPKPKIDHHIPSQRRFIKFKTSLFGHFLGASHISRHQHHIAIRRISTMVSPRSSRLILLDFWSSSHRLEGGSCGVLTRHYRTFNVIIVFM